MSPHTSTASDKSQRALFNPAEFAERLRRERSRIGLNQTDFGRSAGVGLQTQSRYETAGTKPNAEYLAALAANRVDVVYLLTGERSESARIGADASAFLDEYLDLPPSQRALARELVRAVRAHAEQAQPRTMHETQETYRPEPLVTTEAALRDSIRQALTAMPRRGRERQVDYLTEALGAVLLPPEDLDASDEGRAPRERGEGDGHAPAPTR